MGAWTLWQAGRKQTFDDDEALLKHIEKQFDKAILESPLAKTEIQDPDGKLYDLEVNLLLKPTESEIR